MKWMKYVAIGALLSVASGGFASDDIAETPQDYGWGRALTTPESSPWYRVSLPADVYRQSAWPDLRDVRVFNHQGERVPFSLEKQNKAIAALPPTELRIFPLTTSPVESTNSDDLQGERVWLRSSSGYEIKLESGRIEGVGKSYLLVLPENSAESISVSQLQLGWDKPAENWQGRAALYFSTDMREWVLLQKDAPLMDIASGDDRLTLNKIATALTMSPEGPRYLLLVFDTPTLPLTLNSASVVGVGDSSATRGENVSLSGWANRISADEVQYQWSRPQPLNALSVRLDNDGVLPVALEWRASAEDKWQPLGKEVLFHLNEQMSDDIALPGHLVQGIRLTTINAHLPDALPQVSGLRESLNLIFNAQGSGPFILAWGNKAATDVALPLEGLIPASLRQQHAPDLLPEAMAHEPVKLGGESRLSAVSPAEQASQWRTWLVWAVLVLGVLALVWMALKIWRDIQKDNAA